MDFHVATTLIYFAASLTSTLGAVQGSFRFARFSVWLLGIGSLIHTVSLYQLHKQVSTPSLSDMSAVVSLIGWAATLFYVLFLGRGRLAGLSVLVAPGAFTATFYTALRLPLLVDVENLHPVWSHFHVLLSSLGIALLAVGAAAGALYVLQHRRLKSKRQWHESVLPSLEALDRVNALTLALGFMLLTLAVLTGALWVQAADGLGWSISSHVKATLIAWMIYAVLFGMRFVGGRGEIPTAGGAIVGFFLLLIAWIGWN